MRPFRAGVTLGRGTAHDRNIKDVQDALTKVVTSISSSQPELKLQPAADFKLRFADGKDYECQPKCDGWARPQRLPIVRSTVAQLEFVSEAFDVGKTVHEVNLASTSFV